MTTPLIWFIDDDAQTAHDIIHYWQTFKHPSLQFRHFSTASEAWEQLANGGERPNAVVVDGHLAKDEGELSSGANFVRLVRSRSDLKQPVMVAFSGDEFAIDDMQRAGANAGFYKSKVRPVFDYLVMNCCEGYQPKLRNSQF